MIFARLMSSHIGLLHVTFSEVLFQFFFIAPLRFERVVYIVFCFCRSWINHMSSVITDDEQPDDVTSAESFLTRHEEHKAEIDTRQKSVNEFYEAADSLISDGHSASADVKEKKQRLHKAWLALQETWREKGDELEQAKEVQVFKRDADQLEAWLNARDLDQESSDVGDSLDAVEELLKKHEEFENMLLAQEMKLLGIRKLTQQEQGVNKQREEENELREEEERRKREEEEERLEQELKERKRLQELRQKQEDERKEKERKQREETEREKLRVQEEKRRAEAKAKLEEQKKRQEAERQRVMIEEQRRREELKNTRDIYNRNKNDVTSANSPQDQRKASLSSTVEGILQRKQEFESGGKKAHARAWKTLYTVLRGYQLFFYREKKDAQSTNYAAPPIDLKDGFCEEASDAARRKNAFRVLCDDSDFLFVAKDPSDLERWLRNISEAAGETVLPSPPPPPQAARLQSPTVSPRSPGVENGSTPKLAKPYGRTPKPLITVTSFDDDEDVLIDPPPPPPVNMPPPAIPLDVSSDDLLLESHLEDENNLDADSGSIPLEPDSPPAVPPPDFADFDDPSDGDDLPVLPTSPPPEFLSDDENGFDNDLDVSSLDYVPTAFDHPVPPPRSKTKPTPPPVAPKPEGRLRSDSGESLDSVGKGSKPPVKPKPTVDRANLASQRSTDGRHAQSTGKLRSAVDSPESVHDDKRHEKRKGVLGNIFKKKK